MKGLSWALAEIGDSVRRPILRRRVDRLVLEELDGIPLVVLPRVFNPVIFRTGSFLARAVSRARPGSPEGESGASSQGLKALDMGSGSGIGALFAARRGYRVTAVDINPHAVRCVRINALLNGLEDHIDARQGDLFDPVAGERFDLVLFNPPFFRGEPRSDLEAAWRSRDVLERFADGLASVQTPDGETLVVLSTHGGGEILIDALRTKKMDIEVAERHDYGNESLLLYSVRPAKDAPVTGA